MPSVADLSPLARSQPVTDRNEVELDRFNQGWRSSSAYAEVMARLGVDTTKPVKLTDRQRKEVQREMEARGVVFGKGMEVDPAGNVNDKHGLDDVNWKKVGIIGGAAALAAFGLPGVMPGLLTSGGAAGAPLAAKTIPLVTKASMASGLAGGAGAAGAAGAAAAAGGIGMWSPSTLKLIELGVGAGSSFLSQRSAQKSADRAMQMELEAQREALAWEREQDAANRAMYLEERGRDWARQDARDARLTPYRSQGATSVSVLSQLLRERLGRKPTAAAPGQGGGMTLASLSPLAMGRG